MTSSAFERILYQADSGRASITLNRPEKRNAIDARLIEELKSAFAAAATDPAVNVITLDANGKDFCSGADLSALEKARQSGVMANLDDARAMAELFVAMRRHPKLIVAVVHGRALAGGCGLATACDLILAHESAQFGYPEVNIGFVPAMVMAILRRSVPEKRALELIVSGQPVKAPEARAIGLVNQVFSDAEFSASVSSYIAGLAAKSASALTLCKNLLYHMDTISFEAAVEAGVYINGIARMTPDCQRGVDQFLKR